MKNVPLKATHNNLAQGPRCAGSRCAGGGAREPLGPPGGAGSGAGRAWPGPGFPSPVSCRPARPGPAPKTPWRSLPPSSPEDPSLLSQVDECDQRMIGSSSQLFAASLGNLEWLRMCLNLNRGERRPDDKGFTAIHFAAQSGRLACLQVLVEEYKFPVDLPTNSGQTPLHLVIQWNNEAMALACIHYLITQGAALNTRTRDGSTPLHLAARQGLLSCVKRLVQDGANVHAQDAMGCKPIDYCRIWNHRDCIRFLKDAMWKKDKKDFAREMGKLKRLKDQLVLMKQDFLAENETKQQILREANFKKWLHRKQQPQRQSLVHSTQQEPRTPPRATALSKTPKRGDLWPPKGFHLSPKERLIQMGPKPPSVTPAAISKQLTVRRPKVWNPSNKVARPPTTQIGYPQGIRLGVHPDPSPEQDFSNFLKMRADGHGGVSLYTVSGHQVAPVPRLPSEVIIRELFPSLRPHRMKVPQDFCSVTLRDIPQKRRLGPESSDGNLWTDTVTMCLRETCDEAFLAAVRAHQGLPTLPSPRPPPT
ncbi:ankyrin repeat domain-containing protein 53 [Camelus dromedarius]|uniref:ankyrin repeat domain-containing protein 53 n=1 Tax=Camelus dromedarius TaxID=9838 RepID=UPI003119AEB2